MDGVVCWIWIALLLAVLLPPWLLPEQVGALPIIKSLWPILLAMFVAWIVLKLKLFQSLKPISEGDVLVLIAIFFQPLRCMARKLAYIRTAFGKAQRRYSIQLMQRGKGVMERMKWIEKRLAQWNIASFLVVMIVLVLIFFGRENLEDSLPQSKTLK